ncbi:MAG: bacteriohemerythrin, partial [Geobacteraceae bacterium]|nr:bacteriohemerythrin [Geobacteraceae bacterium]
GFFIFEYTTGKICKTGSSGTKMKIVEWNEKYCLGNELIDSHHKHLIELLNAYYNTVSQERNLEEIARIFNELFKYVDYHFKAEEEMMRDYGYAKIQLHTSEHESFENRLNEFQKSMISSEEEFDVEVIYFLEEWLLNHILLSDKELVNFINNTSIHIV